MAYASRYCVQIKGDCDDGQLFPHGKCNSMPNGHILFQLPYWNICCFNCRAGTVPCFHNSKLGVRVYFSISITLTSKWAQWRLKSPASRLCIFVQTQIKEVSKLRVTGLCEGNSPVTGEFPAQRASNAENISIWWRYHGWGLVTHTFIS